MIVAKNVVAFRLGDDTKSQLDLLESIDYKLAVSENRRPLTRTEIVEQAINNYYIQNTNEYKNKSLSSPLPEVESGCLHFQSPCMSEEKL